ncbi:MAG: MATE family efflux transporter [Lachnospiraceae bacterium]|nr:MATE family efflux transporter [Lachnospiraceae bacterium]
MNVKKIDMTKGPMLKLIILFAIPIWIGNILQQLYNTVDTLVVGNYCGPVSIAAVGTSAQPVEFLLCIFLGLGTGVSILVSQNTGKGDTEAVKKVISTATVFLYMCAIPLTILGIFLGPLILKLMKVPADTFDLASTYLIIIFLGTLGNMGYNMNAGILRGIGDSISSLLFLLVSCIVNIVLDLLFVVVFRMGVHGVALATSIAMFISWFISIIYIKNKHAYLEYKVIPTNFSKKILGTIIAVGLPLGLNNSIYSIGHILMQSLINAQGSTFIAACSVAQKLTGIANVAITALSSAATTFAGQNIGAKNYKRVKYGALRIPLFSAAITLTAGLILTLFCRPILGLFTDNSDVLKLATQYTYVVLPFTWGYALLNGIISYVNGTGEVRYPTIINILMLWAVRIPAAYIIATFINGTYVMAAVPISFAFGMTAMLAYFLTPKWKKLVAMAE